MAALEVIALDTVTPQLRAPGAGDTYTFPRAVAMSVPLPVSSGGTGQSTANAGLNALLPSQSGQSGKFLKTDGTDTSWATAGGGGATLTISNKTGAYTVVAGDLGTIINCTTGTFTVSLTAAASLGSGFNCWVWNTGTGVITIDPNGAETIDGVATINLRQGEGARIVCNGTNWETGDKKTMRGYAENIQSVNARPISSGTNAVAIGTSGAGVATASGAAAIAIGSLATAGASFSHAFGYDANVNTGGYSVAIGTNSGGGGSRSTSGSAAMSLGGSYASGTDSLAAAVANNTSTYGAQGANSIAIGNLAKATGTSSIAVSAANALASAAGAIAVGGYNYGVTASALIAIAIGDDCESTAVGATSLGYGASSVIRGKMAFSGRPSGGRGLSQAGNMVLGRDTTGAVATAITTDGSTAAINNQAILPNNSAYAFTGTVVARRQAAGGTESAAWKIEGLIRREGTAASTTLVASTVTAISNAPGWTLALSADTTNGGLTITATGAAATNIRWVATVQTSEVIYA